MRADNGVMLSRRSCFVFFALSFLAAVPSEAGVGEWKNFTSQKNVRSVAADGRFVWAATSGGVFRFDPSDSSYQKFVNSNGLSSNNATAIFIDSFGDVWIGLQNGGIDVYSPARGTWRYISNIKDDESKTNRSINAFVQSGDKMYIAAGFGVTVFTISKFEFSDTYLNFASATQPNVSSVRLFQQRVFAATAAGIVASKAGATNLAAPESWDIFAPVNVTVNALVEFNGQLYASSANGLYKFQANNWVTVGGINTLVLLVTATDSLLYFVDGTMLRTIDTGGNIATVSSSIPFPVSGGTITSGAAVYLGFAANGIGVRSTGGSWNTYFPNGPNSNLFYQIAVDANGTLWAASGRANGTGFYSFNGTSWRNYHTGNTALLLSNDCFAVSVGPNNSKWIGTWGEGAVLVNGNGDVVRRFDYSNPGFIGVIRDVNEGIPSFTVPAGFASDATGAMWAMTYASLNSSKVLWKMKPDSIWESFPGHPFGSSFSFMFGMTIDGNQTKWLTNAVNDRATNTDNIFFYNEKRTLPNTIGGWGYLSKADGLSNTQTQTITVDREGDVWIGTGAGLYVITDPANPSTRISRVYHDFINEEYVNCIVADAENNKWVATKTKGVFVLSPDGRSLLNHFTVKNTDGKLVDDNVISLAIDVKKGIVYFGTEKGLSSLEVAAIETKKSFATIDLSPNPIYLPQHNTVEISGLVDESTIKILSLNGKVVKQFPAQGGGRAFWDCKDSDGRFVASGIYIVVAHNKTGDQTASAKVAVIKK